MYVRIRNLRQHFQTLSFNCIAKTKNHPIEKQLLNGTLPSLTETLVNPFRLLFIRGTIAFSQNGPCI